MNSGYTQIEINGELIGLKFAMPSLAKIYELGQGVDVTNNAMTTFSMAVIVYSGYYNNCLLKSIIPRHDLEFFSDAIDDAYLAGDEALKKYQDVITFFNESKFVAPKIAEADKKKAEESGAGMKLSPSATESLAYGQTIITD